MSDKRKDMEPAMATCQGEKKAVGEQSELGEQEERRECCKESGEEEG